MGTLRSILVHADSTPQSAARVRAAGALAAAHGASVQALYAVLPVYMQYPYSLSISPEAVSLLERAEADRLARARAAFDQAVSAAAAPVGWAVAAGDPVEQVVQAATCSDLVVLGQDDPSNELRADVPADFVASVVIGSGRPALVLPHAHAGATLARVALLAWKPTREAAHALAGALPLLRRADKVHVALWNGADESSTGARDGIARYLALHGIVADVHGYGPESRDVGEYLLSLVSDIGADLLVMGCYGHGRMREWVLGGATRSVLRSMTVPVLMAH